VTEHGYTRAAGERVGPYTLEDPLGRGGFSEVWRARGAKGEVVALKLLIHPEHMSQLRAEASALALVRGDGVVKILALDLEHDPPYLALELLAGGNLRDWLRSTEGSLPPPIAVEVFEEILEVLDAVHEEGIVHGDLKPENVLFASERGSVKLADFGLSRRIAQKTATLSVSLSLDDARLAGTLDYMAPEQRAGEKPSTRSDIYAAGVVLYELLTGERPQGVFAMPSEKNAAIPPIIDRIIASSLAQDPRHRFASAGAVLAFLHSELKTDWKELARAHARVTALLAGGTIAVASSPAPVLIGLCLVVFPLFVVLVNMVKIDAAGQARFVAGAVLGTAITLMVRSLAGPWLRKRRASLIQLRDKLAQQIRSQGEWSRVGQPKAPIRSGEARGGARR
jgi:serine/threonine-protein kinase